MTVPFVSALSPRMPSTESNMATMLAEWMDDDEGGILLSSSDCRRDLQMIENLRNSIGERIHWDPEMEEDLHKYYHYLVECESYGMTLQNTPADNPLCLVWKSSIHPSSVQTVTSLEGEKANILWTIAASEARRASHENLTTKPGWNKASMRLQKAASCIGHLLAYMETHNLSMPEETNPEFLVLWKALLLAQAQHCVYEACVCVPRPMHLLLAKLAAAAVPLYQEVTRIASLASPQMLQMQLYEDLDDFAEAWGAYMSCQAQYHQSQIHKDKKDWGLEIARLDVAYQHAAVCKNLCDNTTSANSTLLDELKTAVDEKLQVLQTRLESAQKENEETHKQAIPEPQDLAEIRPQSMVKSNKPLSDLLLPKTTEPLFQKQPEEPMIPVAAVTIPGSITTSSASKWQSGNFRNDPYDDYDDENDKVPPPMTKIGPPQLSTSSSSSFYQKKMAPRPSYSASSQILETYVEVFNLEMSEIIEDLARASEDQSESARLALNEVHLPHSLRVYQQEQSGGGLPDDLWERVHQLQQENSVIQLKQDLWEIKDAADLAQATYKAIMSQLDFDVDADKMFRKENPDFSGHDAWDAQKNFRKPLANYEKLLSSAQDGDKVLFQRMEQLDIEPKYDLLQFSKAQLDLLLPGAMNDPDLVVDTQHLSHLCGELRSLFQKKADLIAMMRDELENFDVAKAIEDTVAGSRTRTDEDFLEATKHAQKHFEGLRLDIQSCMEHQNELLGTILVENEAFMNSRQRTMNSQSAESCIMMIEDAMDEVDQLSKHLKEGKDFYNVVLPKLDELKQLVDDASARLTVERLEYDDTEKKASQEQKDAEMAQQLNEEAAAAPAAAAPETAAAAAQSAPTTQNSEDSEEDTKPAAAPSPLPVPASVAARSPRSNVDDEKVATLMAMEFDADKVVEALEKHNNDMELALNELLAC